METTLKSTFPRITGQGVPVNERGKAIGRPGSAPETQIGVTNEEPEQPKQTAPKVVHQTKVAPKPAVKIVNKSTAKKTAKKR